MSNGVGASGFALVCPGRGPSAAPPGACASGDVDADVSVGEDGDDAEDTVDADGAGMGASDLVAYQRVWCFVLRILCLWRSGCRAFLRLEVEVGVEAAGMGVVGSVFT